MKVVSCYANFTAERNDNERTNISACYYVYTTFYAPDLPNDSIPKPMFNGAPTHIAEILEKCVMK